MELPFIVVFEPPSREELRAVLRMRGTWAAGLLVGLAVGTCVILSTVARADPAASSSAVSLEVASRPAGAGIWVDGRQRGTTPSSVLVEPGEHSVVFKASNAVDTSYAVQVGAAGASVEAVLWRRQATLTRLRPTLPGAMLSDVRPLADGELALSIVLPPGQLLQAWRLDPVTGAVQPVLGDVLSPRLAVAADGQHVAYLGNDSGPPALAADSTDLAARHPSVLSLVEPGSSAPTSGWRAPLVAGESLADVSWSPLGDQLLVASSRPLPGGALHSRFWFVSPDGQTAREVLGLPSEIVPGSELWSPDAQRVAFIAHAGSVNALCLLDRTGSFRYLADLDPAPAAPLAYPAASWSSDSQRLLFVAPHQHPPGAPFAGWLQPDQHQALFVTYAADPQPVMLGDTDVNLAAWREDGQMLGLGGLGADGALVLSQLAGSSSAQHLVELALKPAPSYALAWDPAHARVLIANPLASGGLEYWLASFGVEGQS